MRILLLVVILISGCYFEVPVATPRTPTSVGKEDIALEKVALQKFSTTQTVTTKSLWQNYSPTYNSIEFPQANTSLLSAKQIYQKYKNSVVVICGRYLCDRCSDWHLTSSSGFMLNDTGVCVTSHHVIADVEMERFIVLSVEQKSYGIEKILHADKENDFVILQLSGRDFTKGIPLAEPVVGDKIFVISHPQRNYYTLTSGIISRLFTPEKRHTQTPYISITADYAAGSSGGPIINENGNVVGIVSYTQYAYAGREVQIIFKNATNAMAIAKGLLQN